MLTAGQEAMEQAIERAGLAPRDIDVFEFAEAFAALCLRFRRDLDAGPERMNPNGGTSIAMGHAAFGATGAIMVGLPRRTGTPRGPVRRGRCQWCRRARRRTGSRTVLGPRQSVRRPPPAGGAGPEWQHRRRSHAVHNDRTSTVNETVAQSRSACTKAACPESVGKVVERPDAPDPKKAMLRSSTGLTFEPSIANQPVTGRTASTATTFPTPRPARSAHPADPLRNTRGAAAGPA